MKPQAVDRSVPFVYERVRRTLIAMICRGDLQVGDKLPSERELAKQLGCNYHTVRRGLALLESDRWIERRVGAGTFVLRTSDEAPAESPATVAQPGRTQ